MIKGVMAAGLLGLGCIGAHANLHQVFLGGASGGVLPIDLEISSEPFSVGATIGTPLFLGAGDVLSMALGETAGYIGPQGGDIYWFSLSDPQGGPTGLISLGGEAASSLAVNAEFLCAAVPGSIQVFDPSTGFLTVSVPGITGQVGIGLTGSALLIGSSEVIQNTGAPLAYVLLPGAGASAVTVQGWMDNTPLEAQFVTDFAFGNNANGSIAYFAFGSNTLGAALPPPCDNPCSQANPTVVWPINIQHVDDRAPMVITDVTWDNSLLFNNLILVGLRMAGPIGHDVFVTTDASFVCGFVTPNSAFCNYSNTPNSTFLEVNSNKNQGQVLFTPNNPGSFWVGATDGEYLYLWPSTGLFVTDVVSDQSQTVTLPAPWNQGPSLVNPMAARSVE